MNEMAKSAEAGFEAMPMADAAPGALTIRARQKLTFKDSKKFVR